MPSFKTSQILPFTPQQMFDLVADIESYPEFLPLCEALRVRDRRTCKDGHPQLIADMTCGRDQPGGTSTLVISIDSPVTAEVVHQIESSPLILRAQLVSL